MSNDFNCRKAKLCVSTPVCEHVRECEQCSLLHLLVAPAHAERPTASVQSQFERSNILCAALYILPLVLSSSLSRLKPQEYSSDLLHSSFRRSTLLFCSAGVRRPLDSAPLFFSSVQSTVLLIESRALFAGVVAPLRCTHRDFLSVQTRLLLLSTARASHIRKADVQYVYFLFLGTRWK